MLKHARAIALAIFAMIPLTAMSAVEPLNVVLKNPSSQEKSETGFITIIVTNRSNKPLLLPKGDSALDARDGRLSNNLIKVVSPDGQLATYRGRATRVATRERDVRFWTINPGQTMTSEVNLAADYDIQGGKYSVSYTQYYIEMDAWNPDDAAYEEAHSNVLSVFANSSLIERERALHQVSLLDTQASGPDLTCNSDQVTAINSARNTASSWAFFSKSASGNLYGVTHTSDAMGNIVWKANLSSDPTYTTWFGAPQNTSPTFSTNPHLDQVWDAGDFLPLHVTSAINARIYNTDNYSCGCSEAEETSGAAAWTEESLTHICSIFFRLPFSTYGTDSQVIIILHENAHHADTYGPYVGDYPSGYGRQKAKTLALSDRATAIKNADNYAYYAEAIRMLKDKATATGPVVDEKQSFLTPTDSGTSNPDR
jgi:hypothetical protein